MTRPYVIAGDGGNSKTDLVLASLDGRLLARRLLPGTRPHLNGGIAAMAEVLAKGAYEARSELGLGTQPPVHGCFCLANVDVPDDEEAARQALLDRGVAETIVVENDTFAVLRAGTELTWGVALVAGAGVNAVGLHPDGRQHRFLALGDFTGDWGGGYSLGSGAVAAGVRAGDGRGIATTLSDGVARVLGRSDVTSVALAIHRGELADTDLLRLAPLVIDEAEAGDRAAVALVERLADELTDYAAAAIKALDLGALRLPIVLGGGILQSGSRVLLSRLHDRLLNLAPHAEIVVLTVSPLMGALATALRAAHASPEAVARARQLSVGPELQPS